MPDQLLNELQQTVAASRSQLEYLRDIGLTEQPASVLGPLAEIQDFDNIPDEETLEDVRCALGDCARCELSQSRTQLVFGSGNPDARLVLVGEAPGPEEDLKGEPFVGEDGQLLDRILLAMGMTRDEVYLCNILKCMSKNNREPLAVEMEPCESFLIRQIKAIRPQVIVVLGSFAVHSLLKSRVPISQLRGEWQSYQGIPLMPTYHPLDLLRNPEHKRAVWEDMKAVLNRLASLDHAL